MLGWMKGGNLFDVIKVRSNGKKKKKEEGKWFI
jgi:hypothetical protein